MWADAAGDAWSDRNEHWLTAVNSETRRRPKRLRETRPLILCGFGLSLKIDRGALVITDGFTHYPQERQTYRFFRGDLNLPPRIIILDGSGGLSFDVLAWLAEQGVALFLVDYRGELISAIGGAASVQDPDRVKWQIETRTDPEQRLAFCSELIANKLRASVRTMLDVLPDTRARQVALARAEGGIHQLSSGALRTVDQIRELEMRAAGAYFTAWRGLELKWRQKWRYPVPQDWLALGSRRSMRGPLASNRHATHPVNAILNYAYATLRSRTHVEALAEGYDPRRGILHHDRDDKDAFAFVFDMMEPGRPVVDAAVIKFLTRTELTGADFTIREDGVCRVGPQLARRVVQVAAAA